MANTCFTIYKITGINGQNEAYNKLVSALAELKGERFPWLGTLATELGLDWEKMRLPVRGNIIHWEDEDSPWHYGNILTLEVESAWTPCIELFDSINEHLGGELSISWRAEEPGCDLYWKHDEGGFFDEDVFCVDADGDVFESFYAPDLQDVIDAWCSVMKYDCADKSDNEMREIIENWEYENEDIYFNIHEFEIM